MDGYATCGQRQRDASRATPEFKCPTIARVPRQEGDRRADDGRICLVGVVVVEGRRYLSSK
jgi:hypothetical protein